MPDGNDINRSPVNVRLKNVRGELIQDEVEIKFYNQRAQSLNQRFPFEYKGAAVALKGVPAFPMGLAEAFIKPSKFRYKSIFIDVPAGKPGLIDETFFAEPGRVKPVFPDFSEIKTEPEWSDLWRILKNSGIGSASAWNDLAFFAACCASPLSGARPKRPFLSGCCSVRGIEIVS